MNILEQLNSINAVKIAYSEADSSPRGYDGAFFGPAMERYQEQPEWLKEALETKKLKLYRGLDYACWSIDNEYGQPITFYPYDYIVHDGNGKIYGLEKEIVDILMGAVTSNKNHGTVAV
jgi:hypothetical protein